MQCIDLVELRVADCLGGQKENKFSCQTRAITHVQSEPASLAPEVNPLLFHAFLPANVILHFPAGSRDVVGHLSAQCSVYNLITLKKVFPIFGFTLHNQPIPLIELA